MAVKGVVYVPEAGPDGWQSELPGVQDVANRPLASRILEELAAAGIDSLAIVAADDRLHDLRACIAADPVGDLDVAFLGLAADHHLAGALRAANGFVGEDAAILHLATGLLGQSSEPLVAHVGAQPEDLRLLLHHDPEGRVPLSRTTERLLGVSVLGASGGRLSLAGVAIFGPGAFARAARVPAHRCADTEDALCVEPTHDLVAVAGELAGEGLVVAAGIANGWCEYSADPRALLELNRSVLDRQSTGARYQADDAGNEIEGRVVIHPTAEISASVILGPSLIGAGARILDAYIGPYTTVGPGAVIENCEIVRSVVGAGARIAHVPGRIEGSTIGRGANIFRDFRLPRALRLHVGAGVEVALD